MGISVDRLEINTDGELYPVAFGTFYSCNTNLAKGNQYHGPTSRPDCITFCEVIGEKDCTDYHEFNAENAAT
ncbi:hypothetical protein [Brucella pituitosa]|uniref:hypothetical protein n=1 Tax=Brucella pituitosa TaxID=571256 RepID=UPI000CFF1F27|nr:hypothetical protein CQ062_18020 [Ochrobactrum sp. MYb68]